MCACALAVAFGVVVIVCCAVVLAVIVYGVQCAALAVALSAIASQAAPLLACAVLVASHYPYRHAPVEILAVPVLASDNFRRALPATLAAVLFASRLRDLLHTAFPPASLWSA